MMSLLSSYSPDPHAEQVVCPSVCSAYRCDEEKDLNLSPSGAMNRLSTWCEGLGRGFLYRICGHAHACVSKWPCTCVCEQVAMHMRV